MSSQYQQFSEDIYCRPFDVQIPRCLSKIYIPVNNSDVDITLIFKDKFNKEYIYEGHSDLNGLVEVDLTLFRKGMLNPYAGIFIITAHFTSGKRSDRVFFNTDTGYYPQLNLSVIDTFYINTTGYSAIAIDSGKFVCCCRATPSCKNLLIDPCTGEGLDNTTSPGGGTCTPGFTAILNENSTTLYQGQDIQYQGFIGGNTGENINIAFDILRNSCCSDAIVYKLYVNFGGGFQVLRSGTIQPGTVNGNINFTANFAGAFADSYIEYQSVNCGTQIISTPIYVDCEPSRTFCFTTDQDNCTEVNLPIYSGSTPELSGGYYIPYDQPWPTIFFQAFPNLCCTETEFLYKYRIDVQQKGGTIGGSDSIVFSSVGGQIPANFPVTINPINLTLTYGSNSVPSNPLIPDNWQWVTLEIDVLDNECNNFETYRIKFSIE